MHQTNVLILGPSCFISTINELKDFLKFNLFNDISILGNNNAKIDLLIVHLDKVDDINIKNILLNNLVIKVLATNKNYKIDLFDSILKLPTSVNDLNVVVENLVAKEIFSKNSFIKIKKEYFLDKNEKKLFKADLFILLTEKEIQLLELLISLKKSVSKNLILSSVWQYSSDADTHTVETHIYRLRKKINDKFLDNNFILNNKDGYYI